jgi:hypothetical protein
MNQEFSQMVYIFGWMLGLMKWGISGVVWVYQRLGSAMDFLTTVVITSR